jgi:hypothetical protein
VGYLIQSGYRAGWNYGKRIAQEWRPESRFLYRVSGKALSNAKNENWATAIDLWKGIVGTGDKKTASEAAFNIAVAYEMQDRIPDALEWAAKSYFLQRDINTDNYIKKLERRLNDQKKLQQQLGSVKQRVDI